MPPQVGSRRSLIVSLVLTIAIAFGSLAATLSLGWGPKLGLDLAGGLSVVYKPTTHATTADMQEVVTILTNRVDGLGVSGATVNLQGKEVVVSVPGVTHARAVLEAVGQTAQLLFRPVICQADVGTKLTAKPLPTCAAGYQMTEANLDVQPSNNVDGFTSNNLEPDPAFTNIASTQPAKDLPKNDVLLPVLGSKGVRYLLGPSELTGHAIKKAVAQQDQTGAWVVNYTLTSTGSPEWDKVASENFHRLLAIELDGVVQSAPIIQPTQSSFSSFDGTGEISGSFTESSAKTLALAMNFGALPVRLQALTTQTISPTLGHSALVAGLGAGLAGLALVLLYTILYYRALGLVIVLGLAVTASLLWAIISALGHTELAPSFDLAGVTGLIVSIGITVDSYIVYFERLKDEARAGSSVRSSVDRGFRSAWRTVLAADTVSLLAAVLLYIIAVGDVKGFAFFLGLSTLMDVFITWYFTRPLVILLGRRSTSSTSKLSMAAGMHAGSPVSNETDFEAAAPMDEKSYGRFGRLYHGLTRIDFVGRRKVWFSVSMAVIILGLASLGFRGFNLGIEFKGGSSWEVLAPNTSITAMTNAVESAGLSNPVVEKLGSDTYQVTADINNLSATRQLTVTDNVVDAMAKIAHTTDDQVSTSSVGPTWGGQITNKALTALIVFFIAVVAYISIRFEPKMAVAAFIAMVHDLLVTVGVYSLFGFQITPDTVIAILTILGYSLYDTVVVFDRVRDNTQNILKGGTLTYSEMVNLSMNQTLARSINTSLVAILPVLSVLLIGADLLGATTLQNYGLALFVGLMSGAYSSIFIASPLLAWMKEREPRYRDLRERVLSRPDRQVLTASSAALLGAQTRAVGAGPARTPRTSGTIQARARKQKRR